MLRCLPPAGVRLCVLKLIQPCYCYRPIHDQSWIGDSRVQPLLSLRTIEPFARTPIQYMTVGGSTTAEFSDTRWMQLSDKGRPMDLGFHSIFFSTSQSSFGVRILSLIRSSSTGGLHTSGCACQTTHQHGCLHIQSTACCLTDRPLISIHSAATLLPDHTSARCLHIQSTACCLTDRPLLAAYTAPPLSCQTASPWR